MSKFEVSVIEYVYKIFREFIQFRFRVFDIVIRIISLPKYTNFQGREFKCNSKEGNGEHYSKGSRVLKKFLIVLIFFPRVLFDSI